MSSNESATGLASEDLLDLLKRDHRRVDHLLDEIEGTDESDERRRAQLFAQVAAEIQVHADAEDEILYTALEARDRFEDLIEVARQEHAHIEQMVEELDQLDVASGEWIGKVRELRQLVRHHVDEEEGTLFPMLRDELGAGERHRLAGEFLAAKDSEEDEELSGERDIAGMTDRPELPPDGERDIESLSKKELYELARSRHIEGRSAMTKAELVHALRSAK